jgi:hypothetical protein
MLPFCFSLLKGETTMHLPEPKPGEYTPNSHKYKKEQAQKTNDIPEKKVEKIVQGTVKTRKKNEIRKNTDSLMAQDAGSIKSHVLSGIILPGIKNMIYNIFVEGLGLALFGDTRRNSAGGGSPVSKISYRSFYDDRHAAPKETRVRTRFDYDDLVFESRGEAEVVLDQLQDMITRYGVATVNDLYDACGLTAPYTSNRYGWMSIRNADVARTLDGGYILRLPKATPID